MPTTSECAYTAGLLDGEGSVTIHLDRRTDTRRPSHSLRVKVEMTEERVVRWMSETWGGSFEPQRLRENCRQAFIWRVSSSHAQHVLQTVRPYLIGKAPHAEIAERFDRTYWVHGPVDHTHPVFMEREALRQEMSSYNLTRAAFRPFVPPVVETR